MLTVAQAIAKTLAAYGTEKFFCMCGGDHDLWYALDDAGIEIVNCRSEQAAVYMADGYARMTGKPGFVYGQRGPGVANLAGALADALWAKSPVISLTSSISMPSRDRFEYQECEGLPLHVGLTKWNKTVSSPDRAAAMLRAAIRIALAPSPGPVHLEIPADMLEMESGEEIFREENLGNVNSVRAPADRAKVAAVIDGLLKAGKPLIVAGKGVIISEAWDELTKFAEALSIPVATSLGGKGAIDEASDLAMGTIGRNSRKIGNDSVRACDALLAIGTRLGGLATHRWTLPFNEKTLYHFDADPHILGHNYRTAIGVAGDAKATLALANEIIAEKKLARPRTTWAKEMTAKLETWRKHAAEMSTVQKVDAIHPADVVAAARRCMGPNDVVGADTGAHGGWVGALFPVRAGKTFIRANGSLGWVVAGAMGAAVGAPDRRVVAITGDGGMLYHMSEFETALRCGIPAVIIVMNNACLASEYHTQKRHQRVIKSVLDFRDVDFAAVARAFGAFGQRVTDKKDLDGAIKAALASGGPALVDVVVSKEAQAPSANRDATRLV